MEMNLWLAFSSVILLSTLSLHGSAVPLSSGIQQVEHAGGRIIEHERSAQDDPYGLISAIVARPGERDALIDLLRNSSADMPGCIDYLIARDSSDAQKIWVTEVWASQKSHEASLGLPAVQEAMTLGRPLIDRFALRAVIAPVRSQPAGDAEIMDAVIEREQAWADAMRKHDFQALDEIMGDDFRLTFVDRPPFAPEGSPALPREAWLNNLRSMTFGPITMEDQRVTLHGKSVATVRMRMTLEQWKFDEHVLPPRYDLTDVWVHRDGRWQVISRISEPLDPEP